VSQCTIQPAEHDALTALADRPTVTASMIRGLQERFGTERARRLLSAHAVQRSARDKFGPGVWWATRSTLEKATAWQVAAFKASWFGTAEVYDLCCGVGGDLVQFSNRGTVVGVESDPEIAALAAANLKAASPNDDSHVCRVDATSLQLSSRRAVHVDPDRRAAGKRTVTPSMFHPTWDDVRRIVLAAEAAVVKLAPATRLHSGESLRGSHRCWISCRGTVREQSLLVGDAVARAEKRPDTRSAVSLSAGGTGEAFESEVVDDREPTPARRAADYIVDPDPAIRAAGLTAAFALQHGLRPIGGPAGFLTGPSRPPTGRLAAAARVLWQGAWDRRRIRRQLGELGAALTSVKSRGLSVDTAAVQKNLNRGGDHPVTLWIARTGRCTYAAITKP